MPHIIDSPNNFDNLISQLKSVLGPKGISSEDVDVDEVKKLMESYISDEKEWSKFALADLTRNYTRNGVADINGNANLLVVVWSPGQSSAIHDHANAHCIMKVLKGELQESLYAVPETEGSQLVAKTETSLAHQSVGYISDDIGLHRISNPNKSDVAISLHLYTPPYASMYGCSMYEAGNGKKHHVNMSKYYSWDGEIVNNGNSSSC